MTLYNSEENKVPSKKHWKYQLEHMKYSESQFFKISAVIQLGSTVLEESMSVMTFLNISWDKNITEVLYFQTYRNNISCRPPLITQKSQKKE